MTDVIVKMDFIEQLFRKEFKNIFTGIFTTLSNTNDELFREHS